MSDGALVVGEVGEVEEEVGLASSGLGGFVVEGFDLVADFFDFGFDGGRIFAVGAEEADFFGGGFPLGLKGLFFGFVEASGFVAGEDFVDEGGEFGVPSGESFFDEFRIFADDFDVEHGEWLGRWKSVPAEA